MAVVVTNSTILVTGATGFLGNFVVNQLLKRVACNRIICLVRTTSKADSLRDRGVELRVADLGEEASLRRAFEGCDTIINIASMGFGHAPSILRACEHACISRGIFVSTTSIFTSQNTLSKRVRIEAEEAVARSAMRFTILRPTMIYGTEQDRNISRLVDWLGRYPVFPVFGDGKSLQQPVYVEDAAAAIVSCLPNEKTHNRSYEIPGPEPITFNSMIDTICTLLERRVKKLHLPIWASMAAVRALGVIAPKMLTQEQVLRINEDKTFDYSAARRDFGYSPRAFEYGVRPMASRILGARLDTIDGSPTEKNKTPRR